MTHAFFKALLFLGAGSVIHAMSQEQDMRHMGGLRKYLPVTYITMLIATLAISGIPGFSGFFSKDEILWKSYSSSHGNVLFWVVGLVTAGLTAFYMFRLIYLTFHGKERMSEEVRHHIHESPKSMTIPLSILAILSVIGGYVGLPHLFFGATNYFEKWLEPVLAEGGHEEPAHALASSAADTGTEWLLMASSVVLVLVMIYLARYFYNKRLEAATALRAKLSGVHKLLLNKYYVDEIYGAAVVRPVVYGSLFLWKFFDVVIIDGFINGLASVYRDISNTLRYMQSGRLRNYATIFMLGVVIMVGYFVLR